MRGCLTFVVGLLLGVGLMLYWWPKAPAAESVPASSDIRIHLSDRYLGHLVQSRVSSMGVTGVSVSSAPPQTLIAQGTLGLAIVSAPIAIQFQPVAQGGTLQVKVVDVRVGSIPLPGQLIPLIAGSINSSVRSRLGTKAVVQSVQVTPTGLDVEANSR